ncbi:MAG: hydantoinase/oxoprolinase N-terminal domain-containing protein [Waddliaceae bacterium]
MIKKYTIGIDIGGTHTDAVLVDENLKIVASFKTETTSPLEEGVKTGITFLLESSGVDKTGVNGIYVGTTHATNAILKGTDLYRVGVIRLAGHYPTSLRPCFAWPKEVQSCVFSGCETIDGGSECDSRVITPFNPKQAREAIDRLLEKGTESLAIVGVFSPIAKEHECLCAEEVKEVAGTSFPVSLSHEIGGIGFIERENATILNAALKKPMEEGFRHLEDMKNQVGLNCPLFLTQNDGSLINLFQAITSPLLTVSSGPTNSFIGASKLAGVDDAIIVDIGGTSTDIGMVQNGYPRRSMHNAHIGGIPLNFRMPDVMAMAIGGGSQITKNKNGGYLVGPESCGRRLTKEAQIFGGDTLTLTDLASLTETMNIIGANKSAITASHSEAEHVLKLVTEKIQYAVQVMKGNNTDLPVVFVGGGAEIGSSCSTVIPEHYSVANAYGAALAEISATVDTVTSLVDREKTLKLLKTKALNLAISKGALEKTARIVDVQVIPYHYVPNQLARVVVVASGCHY